MSLDNHFLLRRLLLSQAAGGAGALALAMLHSKSVGADAESIPTPKIPPRAKRVIWLYMDGGISHLDTFDPKPRLTKDFSQQEASANCPIKDMYDSNLVRREHINTS